MTIRTPLCVRFTFIPSVVIASLAALLCVVVPSGFSTPTLAPVAKHETSLQTVVVTPIKISLNGKHADINNEDRFTLDLDGFSRDNAPLRITPGGLNINEAWLTLDRTGNGTWEHNVLDNDDVFGDHVGRVANGYVDLEHTFRHEIKMDSKGNRYIDLTGYNPLGEAQLWFCRQFLGDTTPYASYDLKLLAIDRSLTPARDTLQKIYVTPWTVREYDTKHENAILKRAWVQYNDGHFAQSADQYFIFVQGIIRKLSPAEEAQIRKELEAAKKAKS